ncbi:hypothetical protein BS78_02G253300 [Paspalum vaginatum]|nr:hypothetical protein BS78_02G253300 [Paspalum vaginatum]KAJ1290559.1 hypothetical protein BS78_02G253300 [Paspalum vaginatum]KAJ1290561.1 hypothetical protein BS78_02G253300 [Paspalum vaginatum]
MVLLALRLGSLLPAPAHRRRILRNRCRGRIFASNGAAPVRDGGAAAVVWFKHDLRIDDHPGLAAAVAEPRRPVVPLYVFDRRILAGYSDKMLELLLFALKDLKTALKSQDSDLLIGLGNAEDVVLKLVNEVQAGLIFTEEEVEYRVCSVLDNVKSSLSSESFSWGNPPKIVAWTAPLYDSKNLAEVSTSHDQFLKTKLPMATPLPATTLPALNLELDTGSVPTLEELKGFLKGGRTPDDDWAPLKNTSARSILKKMLSQMKIKSNTTLSTGNGENTEDISIDSGPSGKRIMNSMFASENSLEVRGGTNITLDALAAYLRYLEGTGNASWQELHDKVRFTETREGASFYTLFGPAIQLGVISRRKAYNETIQYEKDRNAGFLSPFGYSTPTVTAAVDALSSMEWYWFLALKSQLRVEGKYPIRIWRWKGYLVQYTFLGNEGPAVLLVHGFGASLEHFRDNIDSIADTGHRVWAITLVGFGKSEKPNVNYSELFWSELLRDFLIDVVREPVHLVGNSIGGYICAIAAGLWPSLAKSLVLLNSAGSVVPNYSFVPFSEERRTTWLSRLQAGFLLLFLRSRAEGILKEYYPTRTERVDKPLVHQIIRASYDPGAATVLESIFNFNLSIPLNFLFDSFGGKILVIQGMKDPLTKSEVFVTILREHCSKVQIRELNAGHAPHDEVPEEVNTLLCKWIEQIEVTPALEKTKAI